VRGFVEDAWRAEGSGSETLLDADQHHPVSFPEKLQFDAPLPAELRRAHRRMRAGESFDESFYSAALALVRSHREYASRMERLPALRASTRTELFRRVGIATAFLHATLDRNVAVEEAARVACLSPFHFHRLFLALHGTTPHRYVRQLRLERARTMLRAGWPVIEAALACGFESVSSFTALFRKSFGLTPGAIRRNEEARPGEAR
jgi:AraC-like DNA-binding protein